MGVYWIGLDAGEEREDGMNGRVDVRQWVYDVFACWLV